MLRKCLILISSTTSLLVLFFLFFGRPTLSVQAAPVAQNSQNSESEVNASEPVSQPVHLRIRQRTPLTLSLLTTQAVTTTASPTKTVSQLVKQTVSLNLDLVLDVVLSDTGSSKVPLSITLSLGGQPTTSLPISVALAAVQRALADVSIELLAPPVSGPVSKTVSPSDTVTTTQTVTSTNNITNTEPVTATSFISATAPVTPSGSVTVETGIAPVEIPPAQRATTVVTANVRSAPELTGELREQLPGNTGVNIVAQSADQNWLLLENGYWISVIVVDAVPADLPVASDALVQTLRETPASVLPEPTATPLPTPPPTPVPPTEPPPAATQAQTSTVTETTPLAIPPAIGPGVNLRKGPGTDFDIITQTVEGQVITIVGRTAVGDWYRLDNGAWVNATLVANVTVTETIPVLNNDGSPVEPAAEDSLILPTPTPRSDTTGSNTAGSGAAGGNTLPTNTPRPTQPPKATPVPTATAIPPLTVSENLYLREVNSLRGQYNDAAAEVTRLIDAANQDNKLFKNEQWTIDVETALALIRQGSEKVRGLRVPERFATPNRQLAEVTDHFDAAAGFYETGIKNQSAEQLQQAADEVAAAQKLLAEFEKGLEALKP